MEIAESKTNSHSSKMNPYLAESLMRGNSLFEATVEYVQDYILRNKLQPGDKMPTQAELFTEIGVSRPVIREAMRYLESCGLLISFQGKGVYVARQDIGSVINPMRSLITARHTSLTELMEAREILEPQIARMACLRMTDETLERMQENISYSYSVLYDRDKFIKADADFHQLIVVGAKNTVFEILIRPILQIMEHYELYSEPEKAIYWHTNILNAFAEKNPDKAMDEMLKHICGIKELFLKETPIP